MTSSRTCRTMEAVPSLSSLCITFIAEDFQFFREKLSALPPHLKSYILPLLCKRGFVNTSNISKVGWSGCCVWKPANLHLLVSTILFIVHVFSRSFSYYHSRPVPARVQLRYHNVVGNDNTFTFEGFRSFFGIRSSLVRFLDWIFPSTAFQVYELFRRKHWRRIEFVVDVLQC